MVIGIFLSHGSKYVGGGYVYQKCLLEEIMSKQGTLYARHQIIFFYDGDDTLRKELPENFVNTRWYNGGLNEAAMRHRVDMIWSLSVTMAQIDIPHILPVWDLQHCLQPFFPEVSSGTEYQNRHNGYSGTLPRATYILTGTQAGKDEISLFYRIPPERIVVNPLPLPQYISPERVEMPAELKPLGLVPQRFLFYPAQFWPHKNHVLLLEAIRLLKSKGAEYQLVLTGSDYGNLPYIRRRIAEMGLERDVLLPGFVETESLLWLYQNSLALTYPSLFGPDNIPPIEAFAAGCPVVAARVNGSQEQLGAAALLVDPRDEKCWVSAILRLTQEAGLRESLVAKGRRVAAERTAEIYVRKVFQLIDDFAAIRRCWDSHFRINYTPQVMDWLNGYLNNGEIHALTTLLSLCADGPLDDIYRSMTDTFESISSANREAENAIALGEHGRAFDILQKLVAGCVDYAPAYRNLAKVHYARQEVDTAYTLIQRANYYDTRLKAFS